MVKEVFYAVRAGRVPGIYRTWAECENQVKAFAGAAYKKFPTLAGAEAFMGGVTPLVSVSRPEERVSSSFPASSNDGEWKEIFTDGACRGNGQANSVAGVGVWFGDNHPGNISERCPGDQTNNRAELIAIIRALENTPPSEKIIIKTDSAYSRGCIEEWLPKWRLNGFCTANGEPVKNLPLILYLSELLSAKPARTFRFEKVPAHSGIHGNECADSLATQGCAHLWRPELDDEWSLSKVSRHAQKPSPVPPSSKEQLTSESDEFTADDILSADELAAELEE